MSELNTPVELDPSPVALLAAEVMSFLQTRSGETITPAVIAQLGQLVIEAEQSITEVYSKWIADRLLGMHEVAETLGVSKQRVYQLRKEIPPALARIAASPIWLRDDIERFHRTRKT